MLLREIFIGGARAPPAPPHATALHEETLLHTHCEVRSSLDLWFYTIKPEMFDNEYSNPIHKHPWQIGPHQLSWF